MNRSRWRKLWWLALALWVGAAAWALYGVQVPRVNRGGGGPAGKTAMIVREPLWIYLARSVGIHSARDSAVLVREYYTGGVLVVQCHFKGHLEHGLTTKWTRDGEVEWQKRYVEGALIEVNRDGPFEPAKPYYTSLGREVTG